MIFLASFLQARKCGQSFSFFVSGEPNFTQWSWCSFVNKWLLGLTLCCNKIIEQQLHLQWSLLQQQCVLQHNCSFQELVQTHFLSQLSSQREESFSNKKSISKLMSHSHDDCLYLISIVFCYSTGRFSLKVEMIENFRQNMWSTSWLLVGKEIGTSNTTFENINENTSSRFLLIDLSPRKAEDEEGRRTTLG